MERLFEISQRKMKRVANAYQREFIDKVYWEDPLVGIRGARGVGKTTLLLQQLKRQIDAGNKALYISLDDLYFQENTLVGLAEEFELIGGTHLFLDEVHKYSNWSIEVKNIYDTFDQLKVVFTGSSLLEIYRGEADLSRRAVSYEMRGLSFREYLAMEGLLEHPKISLGTLMDHHVDLAQDITQGFHIIPAFRAYLEHGYYPYYREGLHAYEQKIGNTINLILETDVPAIHNTTYQTTQSLKKLLAFISRSVPFTPNITELSRLISTSSRSATLRYLQFLDDAHLIANLRTAAKGKNYLTKPDKIYLENTNISYALGLGQEDKGNLRECFFFNQLRQVTDVNTSKESDFLVDGRYTFEIGGRHKKLDQIRHIPDAFVAADDTEVGFGSKIPLWLFGFLK